MKFSEIKIGSILSYIIVILNALISIFYMPFLTQKLGQSEFGLYSLISSIIAYMTILDMGFGNSIIVYTSKFIKKGDGDSSAKLNGMFILIYCAIGIIALILGIALYFILPMIFSESMSSAEIEKAKILTIILTINMVITFPLSVFSNVIIAYEKFIFNKTINLLRVILQPLIMIPLLINGYRSISLVLVITIINIFCLLINAIYAFKVIKIKFIFRKLDFRLFKEVFGYSFYIFLSLLVVQLNWNIDNFIIGVFWGTTFVSVYSVALQLTNAYTALSSTVGNVLLPQISKMEENHATSKQFTDLFIATGRIQFYIVLLILSGFIIYGHTFINIFFGEEYENAYLLTCILMISISVQHIQTLGIDIIQAKNKYRYRILLYTALSIINFICSIFLIKEFSYFGAAICTGVTTALCELIMIFYYQHYIKLNMLRFWKNIFNIAWPLLILFIIGWAVNVFVIQESLTSMIVQALIYIFLYCIGAYLFSMNKTEKTLFRNLIPKYISK